jgi:biotin carboxyl carrier protein
MTFEVEIGGRVRRMSVEGVGATGPAGGRFRITVASGDGGDRLPALEVDARATDLGLSMVFLDDRRSVDVAATERARGDWLVQLPHVTIAAQVDGRRGDRGARGAASAQGEQRVLAPMPGRVVRVLVKPGDEVALRQGLVVVEAMKMENELGSPKAGRVKQVEVAEGVSVEAGRLLVVIE